MDSSTTYRLLRQIRQLIRMPAQDQASDRQLLERFANQHDEAAFRLLVERHGPLVLGVGRRLLGDVHEAEDVFQATFLVLARKAGAQRWRASVGPWLYQVAYRLALKTRTDLGRQRAAERQVRPGQVTEPEAEVSRRELARVLDEEVERLPVRYRLPIVLCYLEGRSNAEAAMHLGWRVSTLKGRLARARAMLRSRLSRRGLALAAGTILLPEETASAAVSPSLATSTARIASLLAANEAAEFGGASAVVTRLAEGMLHAMWVSKVKAAAAVMLVLVLAGGAGLLTHQVLAGRQQGAAPAEPPKPLTGGPSGPQTPPMKPARTDRFGDPLPEGALARLGTSRFRYGGDLRSVAFSPDGRTLAIAGYGSGVRLWEVTTGKELCGLPMDSYARTVAFLPDGRCVAVGGIQISLWDVVTGKKLFKLAGHGYCWTARFSPDGKILATGGEGLALCLWDVATGQEIRRMDVPQEEIQALAFSPDGKVVAAGGSGKSVYLWDPATGKVLGKLVGHPEAIDAVIFSPDGRTLASGTWDESIRLWNRTTQKLMSLLPGDAASLAFSPDGKILAAGNGNGMITLWDAVSRKELRRWRAGGAAINSVAFSPDGQTLLTGSALSCGPRLWRVATGEEIRPTGGHHSPVKWLAFSSDGRSLFSASWEKEIFRWDLTTGSEQPWFDWFSDPQSSFTVTPDGRKIVTRGWPDHPMHLWDTTTRKGRPLPLINQDWDGGHPHSPVAFSPDNKLIAGPGKDGAIHLVEADGTGDRRLTEKLPDILQAVAFSPDGKLLAAGASNGRQERWAMGLWEVATGKELLRRDLPGFVNILRFSPDGRLLASSCSQNRDPVRLWDGRTGKELYQLDGSPIRLYDLTFSPDGRFLALAEEHPTAAVSVWEVCTGRRVRRFRGHLAYAITICFSPDGRLLTSGGGDSTILLWDLILLR